MTKEQKLKELGYKMCFKNPNKWVKSFRNTKQQEIATVYLYLKGKPEHSLENITIYTQKDIDAIQIIFNNVNRDYKEVMKLGD